MDRLARLAFSISLLGLGACASARGASSESAGNAPPVVIAGEAPNGNASAGPTEAPSSDSAIPIPTEITRAVETRIADLKTRGGDCTRLGAVVESSYRAGQITLRPYMWRVGTHLASGEAKPNGEMTLAREIDSLNVGVRTVDDVLWTMEHEAAHIAFDIASGSEASEERVNQTVRACKG